MSDALQQARDRIAALDQQILHLAAQRLQAAREAGQAKGKLGLPTVDFQQERQVLERVRAAGRSERLPDGLAEELVTCLLLAGVSQQETDRVVASAHGHGRTAVVVGGAGRMGRWLVRFLQDAGHRVLVLDPAGDGQANQQAAAALANADLVLVATPPSVAASLYNQWASHPPRGVVADIASIKSPLVGPLRALQKAGTSVASFHPLFGPSLASLRGADIVLCTAGDAKAEQAIRALFAPTCARLVDVSLEEHDHLMAEVLSLAHATAIAYAAACSGPTAVHSTTQRKLAGLAASVVRESPQVYFEIQAGNPHSAAALQRLESALAALHEAVRGGDARGFAALLEKGRRKLPVEAGP